MAPAPTKRDQPATRRFYTAIGVFVILLSIAGFGPSLIDPSKRNGPPTALVIFHGVVTFLFLLLFLTQAFLIASERRAVHRRLGIAGAILALAVVVLGFITSIEAQRRGYDLGGDLTRESPDPKVTRPFPPADVIFPLWIFLNFGGLVAAALWYRHRPEVHKRLMLLAVLVPLGNESLLHLLGRLTIYWPGLQGAIVGISLTYILGSYLVNPLHDWLIERRIHPVSWRIPILLFVTFNFVAFVIRPSSAWLRFSEWLIRGK